MTRKQPENVLLLISRGITDSIHYNPVSPEREAGSTRLMPHELRNGGSSARDLSIVIPAFNEERRLPQTLERIWAYLGTRAGTSQVIVVDDGSTDATAAVAQQFSRPDPKRTLRVLTNPGNRGKGYSVRHGMLESEGALLLFSDADLSAPIEELAKLEAALDAGADIAIGSRAKRELIQVHQSRFREFAGRTFNRIVSTAVGLPFRDTQCGFKLFRRCAALQIFPWQRLERWAFDVELLYIARLRGLKAVEIPVKWAHAEGAKIHMMRDSLHMFVEVFQVLRNRKRGLYDLSSPPAVPIPTRV
jgi:glycosyltransferase involved in cell wall biosynthesis